MSALMAGERVLLEANAGILVLTTHRVRLTQRSAGDTKVVSITLPAVSSCSLTTVSYPALLGLALIAAVVGFGLVVSSVEGVGCTSSPSPLSAQLLSF